MYLFTPANSHHIQSRQFQIARVLTSRHSTILTRSFTKTLQQFNKQKIITILSLGSMLSWWSTLMCTTWRDTSSSSCRICQQLQFLTTKSLPCDLLKYLYVCIYPSTGMHMGSLCKLSDCCRSSCTVSTLPAAWAKLYFLQDNYND